MATFLLIFTNFDHAYDVVDPLANDPDMLQDVLLGRLQTTMRIGLQQICLAEESQLA